MSFWKKIFGGESPTTVQTTQLYSSTEQRNVAKLIQEASKIADEGFRLEQRGSVCLASTNTEVGASLVSAIENALVIAPDDADLLVAKYAALTFSWKAEEAQPVLQRALTVAPNHFDARMLRDHADSWRNPFHFPSWSEGRSTLHPVMAEWLGMRQSLQIVRDGLSLGLAVVNPGKADGFPSGIRRSGWKVIWSKTPHGSIAFHYALLDLGSGGVRKQEAGTPHVAEQSPTVRSGYWILRRLPHIKSCFVVFADGSRVLHNARYQFPESLRAAITVMNRDLEASGPVQNASSCQAAGQWYMQNVDFNSIGF